MSVRTAVTSALLASAVATAIASVAAAAPLTKAEADAATAAGKEKCYGVAKAGKNDCAGAAHACAGQSSKDSSPKEFIAVPKGTCERIVGGSLTPGK